MAASTALDDTGVDRALPTLPAAQFPLCHTVCFVLLLVRTPARQLTSETQTCPHIPMPVIQGQLLALPLRIATETPRPELKLIKKLPNESCSSTAADILS